MELRYSLLPELIMFVGMVIGFIYCAYFFFRPQKKLFYPIIACALLCVSLGQLFTVVQLIANGTLPEEFNVGLLGIAGGYSFFLSSVYGLFEKYNSSKSKRKNKYKKQNVLSVIVSTIILVLYVPLLFSDLSIEQNIVYGIFFVFFALIGFFSTKYLLLADVCDEITSTQKGYNIALLMLTVALIVMIYADTFELYITWVISLCICALIFAFLGKIANWRAKS